MVEKYMSPDSILELVERDGCQRITIYLHYRRLMISQPGSNVFSNVLKGSSDSQCSCGIEGSWD
jgi:hypothetical protein